MTSQVKHRCQCFSQASSSFLYGLRREAPSTQRVLLERLLNVLSRAAAQKNKNPQRLWAESERPPWWIEVTNLPWKNPREHPKDSKETLKKKIDILEMELTNRKQMSEELENELDMHRTSKKVDLELKSDFEAIIAKASGLHYMLKKVKNKMGKCQVSSDKIARYITETKACIEASMQAICSMYERVQDRERRKTVLWEKMGVSKDEVPEESNDLQIDSSPIELELLPPETASVLNFQYLSSSMLHTSPPLSPIPASTPSTQASAPTEVGELSVTQELHKRIFTPPSSENPHLQHKIQNYLRFFSQPSPTCGTAAETVHELGGSLGKGVSFSVLTAQPSAKKSRRFNTNELKELDSMYTQVNTRVSPVQQPQPMNLVLEDLPILRKSFAPVTAMNFRPISQVPIYQKVSKRNDGSQAAETGATRRKDPRHQQLHLNPFTAVGSETMFTLAGATEVGQSQRVLSHPTATVSLTDIIDVDAVPVQSLQATKIQHPLSSASRSTSSSSVYIVRSSSLAAEDLSEDCTELEQDDLENVEAIIEEGERPTVTMYTDSDVSEMDQLAQMTRTLSCDELRPSITDTVMGGLSKDRPSTITTVKLHNGSVTSSDSSKASSKDDSQSLSQAIASFGGNFLH